MVGGIQGYTELAISCGVSTCGYIVACQSVSWEVQPRTVKRQMHTFWWPKTCFRWRANFQLERSDSDKLADSTWSHPLRWLGQTLVNFFRGFSGFQLIKVLYIFRYQLALSLSINSISRNAFVSFIDYPEYSKIPNGLSRVLKWTEQVFKQSHPNRKGDWCTVALNASRFFFAFAISLLSNFQCHRFCRDCFNPHFRLIWKKSISTFVS